ncbi:MAG: response regulator [Chthoniobacterales bacterium]
MKTLVVEDNPTDLKLLHIILQLGGHEVMDAIDAEQAFYLLQQSKPQVILIDLLLPNMDGLAMGRRLKQTPDTARIPIIAVTADPDHYPQHAAYEAGFTAYFTKPIDTRTLSEQVTAIANAL